jgi:hypothetical protein
MSIFGDFETPEAKRQTPDVSQLADLSVVVRYAVHDAISNSVHLRADATTSCVDGTTRAGIPLAFFLNGQRLTEIITDEFGVATLDFSLTKALFKNVSNTLIVRVPGLAKYGVAHFDMSSKELRLSIVSHWETRVSDNEVRGLHLRIDAEPQGLAFSIKDTHITIDRVCKFTNWEPIAAGKLDDAGRFVAYLPDYYWDKEEQQRNTPYLTVDRLRVPDHRTVYIAKNICTSFFVMDNWNGRPEELCMNIWAGLRVSVDGWQKAVVSQDTCFDRHSMCVFIPPGEGYSYVLRPCLH